MRIISGFNTHLRCFKIWSNDRVHVHSKLLQASPVFLRCFSLVSHYDTLDVPKNASQDEIKKSFFEKSKKYHPDVSPGNPHHHKLFVKLNNAYSVLSNVSKRKAYDRSLIPKRKTYPYQSNENFYKYSEETFHYGARSRPKGYPMESTQHQRNENINVALWALAFMVVGATLCFLVIGNRHRAYQKQLDHNSMKASKSYQESRERSSKYGFRKQMEMLAEKQGKSIKKP